MRKSPLSELYDYVYVGVYSSDNFILRDCFTEWNENRDEIMEQLFAEYVGFVEGEK